MLSGQQQVSMQEAVHMVDNQELVICSGRITYVSLAQGQALQSETDKSQKKDLIAVYRNRNGKTSTYCWNSTFIVFSLIQHSTNRERKTHLLTNTAS
jgi:hypothetical protein